MNMSVCIVVRCDLGDWQKNEQFREEAGIIGMFLYKSKIISEYMEWNKWNVDENCPRLFTRFYVSNTHAHSVRMR